MCSFHDRDAAILQLQECLVSCALYHYSNPLTRMLELHPKSKYRKKKKNSVKFCSAIGSIVTDLNFYQFTPKLDQTRADL